jgi:hypothetical protein
MQFLNKTKHAMNAQKLKKFLTKLEERGVDLSKVDVNFREDFDSDVVRVKKVSEDLFDETNTELRSIVLYVKD